jgi:hypothetical protein
MKMAVFWVVAPCSLVEVHQRFRGPCCLHHQGDVLGSGGIYVGLEEGKAEGVGIATSVLKIETVCSSKTLVSTCKSTWRHNPEEHHQLKPATYEMFEIQGATKRHASDARTINSKKIMFGNRLVQAT